MSSYKDREKNRFNAYDYYIFKNWYKDKYGYYPYNNLPSSWDCCGEFRLYSDKERKKIIVSGCYMNGTKFEIIDQEMKIEFVNYLNSNFIPNIDNKEDIIKEVMDKVNEKYTIENLLTELTELIKTRNMYKELQTEFKNNNEKYDDLCVCFGFAIDLIKENNILDSFNNKCNEHYNNEKTNE